MVQVTIEQAEGKLADLIQQVQAGEEVQITGDGQILARLVSGQPRPGIDPVTGRRIAGLGRGTVLYMAPDFNAPLEDFAEYM